MYLKGRYSGSTSSQRDCSKYGTQPKTLIIQANRANGETPIMGDNSTSRSALGRSGICSASSEYFTASAPPFE